MCQAVKTSRGAAFVIWHIRKGESGHTHVGDRGHVRDQKVDVPVPRLLDNLLLGHLAALAAAADHVHGAALLGERLRVCGGR